VPWSPPGRPTATGHLCSFLALPADAELLCCSCCYCCLLLVSCCCCCCCCCHASDPVLLPAGGGGGGRCGRMLVGGLAHAHESAESKGLLESYLGFDNLLLQQLLPHASNPTSPLTPRRCAFRECHCLRSHPSRAIQSVCRSSASHTPPTQIWLRSQGSRIPGRLVLLARSHQSTLTIIPTRRRSSATTLSAISNLPRSSYRAAGIRTLRRVATLPYWSHNERYTKPRWSWQQRGQCHSSNEQEGRRCNLRLLVHVVFFSLITYNLITIHPSLTSASNYPYGIGDRIPPAQSLYR